LDYLTTPFQLHTLHSVEWDHEGEQSKNSKGKSRYSSRYQLDIRLEKLGKTRNPALRGNRYPDRYSATGCTVFQIYNHPSFWRRI